METRYTMKKKTKEKLQTVLTVVGWVVIAFAIVALVRFILNLNLFSTES